MKWKVFLIFGICYLVLFTLINAYFGAQDNPRLDESWLMVPTALIEAPQVILWVIFGWGVAVGGMAVLQAPFHIVYYLGFIYLVLLLLDRLKTHTDWRKPVSYLGLVALGVFHVILATGFVIAAGAF